MNKRPFNIFPSAGYKNSQFQVLSTVNNLKIELFFQEKLVKAISLGSKNTTLIHKLNNPGIYSARCVYKDQQFEQEIEVKDAFRLGSSEFKKAFVFENSAYTFFLMKDRLLLYDETNKFLLTENHYSPTKIHQIDKTNYLFLTEIGVSLNGIVNLGIYNIDSFSITGELLNDFQAIRISPEKNRVWLFNKTTESIHCFELISHLGKNFSEIRKYDYASQYTYYSEKGRIYIDHEDKIILIDTENLHNSFELAKTPNNAIDKNGNNLIVNGEEVKCINDLEGYNRNVVYSEELNLDPDGYLYIGSIFRPSTHLRDLLEIGNEIKDKLITSLPKNKTNYHHSLSDDEIIKESIFQHSVFPTQKGLFILKKEIIREFNGLTLRKIQGSWKVTPRTLDSKILTLTYHKEASREIKAGPTKSFNIRGYINHCLIAKTDINTMIFSGEETFSFKNESSFSSYFIGNKSYILVKSEESYSLYSTSNLPRPLLKDVEIYNIDFIGVHKMIWYSGKEKQSNRLKFLNAFDLTNGFHIHLDENKAQHSLFKNASDYKFNNGFMLSSNQVVIDPVTTAIKDAVIGSIEFHSKKLNKIVSHRSNHIYLSIFNQNSKKYEETEIRIEEDKYKESYLSPSGKFLILQDQSNKYLLYDIEKNETTKFLSSTFLTFSKEGNLIIEEDGTRVVKIIDPLTNNDITPPNYHHYRFLSPDGKLYAQVASKTRFFNKLNGNELTRTEVLKLRQDLDFPSIFLSMNSERKQEYERVKERVNNNRRKYFLANKAKFAELSIENFYNITSHDVVRVEKFTEIGIVGTDITVEVIFPEDLAYYNYSAFSYDNKYFGYVGKPSSKGLIHFFKLEFDEKHKKLSIIDSYLSRYPRYASWVCGFSKTGYFATYDSTPDTYIISAGEQLFETKTNEQVLQKNIYTTKTNIYHSYNMWNKIKSKNFLCFSPSGEYLALSEQGYEPLTLGGYGHQESNAVHIAKTESGQIVDSFTGHGDKIKDNKSKKVTFVAFSEDEKRIMTLGSDGVVVIRNIDIDA